MILNCPTVSPQKPFPEYLFMGRQLAHSRTRGLEFSVRMKQEFDEFPALTACRRPPPGFDGIERGLRQHGVPPMTLVDLTLPLGVTVASILTVPEICILRARSG